MNIRIYKKDNGLLYFHNGTKESEVFLKPLFPWSSPDKFISLRDDKDKEIHLIEDLGELNENERSAIKNSLEEMDFTMKIVSVLSIEEDIELRRFKVQLTSGLRQFQTKLDEWPRTTNDGSIHFEDLFGDQYVISDLSKLDKDSLKALKPYIS